MRQVQLLGGYTVRLQFDDGAQGDVDVSKLTRFEGVFEPLRDLDYFRQVRIEPDLGTICWPNGADLDPETLYMAATGDPRRRE